MIVTPEDLDNTHDTVFELPHKPDSYIFVINKETSELTVHHGKDRMDYCNLRMAIVALSRVQQLQEQIKHVSPK